MAPGSFTSQSGAGGISTARRRRGRRGRRSQAGGLTPSIWHIGRSTLANCGASATSATTSGSSSNSSSSKRRTMTNQEIA
jgi:hypothetical protein